jgi:hypothetical protein
MAVVLGLAACQRDSPSPAKSPVETPAAHAIEPQYDKAGKLTLLAYDSNGDGKPDTWAYMDGAQLLRVETDENGDGKVDRWEYHGKPPAGAVARVRPDGTEIDPTLERVEEATRYNGKVSRWEYFDAGVLTRVEEDTNGDGKVDKWETYTNGELSMMALDTTGRGKPDRRFIYNADGTLNRIETDPSGSGTFRPVSQASAR